MKTKDKKPQNDTYGWLPPSNSALPKLRVDFADAPMALTCSRYAVYRGALGGTWRYDRSAHAVRQKQLAAKWREYAGHLIDRGHIMWNPTRVWHAMRCPTFEKVVPGKHRACDHWYCPYCRGRLVRKICLTAATISRAVPRSVVRVLVDDVQPTVPLSGPGTVLDLLDVYTTHAPPYRKPGVGAAYFDQVPGRLLAGFAIRQPWQYCVDGNRLIWGVRRAAVLVTCHSDRPLPYLRNPQALGKTWQKTGTAAEMSPAIAAAYRYPPWVLNADPEESVGMIATHWRLKMTMAAGPYARGPLAIVVPAPGDPLISELSPAGGRPGPGAGKTPSPRQRKARP